MASVHQLQTATDSREDAERIARALVEGRIAACAQVVGPITSVYWWKGEVETAEEFLVLVKASDAYKATKAIVDLHSYDVPEVLAFSAEGGHPPYMDWVEAEARG